MLTYFHKLVTYASANETQSNNNDSPVETNERFAIDASLVRRITGAPFSVEE
jgi:hypothetical protein